MKYGTTYQDLSGKTFGRLSVIERAVQDGKPHFLCRCECGASKVIMAQSLRDGSSTSCGCLAKELTKQRSTKHGHWINGRPSGTYSSWEQMNHRCLPTSKYARNYFNRGITVCSEWQQDFEQFLKDMGPRPPGTSIDRIDNNRGYHKENCRWATMQTQRNNSRQNKYITIGSETKTMADWARHYQANYKLVRDRIRKGWQPIEALMRPRERSRFVAEAGL